MEAPDANKPASSKQITIIEMDKRDEVLTEAELLARLKACKGKETTLRDFIAAEIRGKDDAAQQTVFLDLLQLCKNNPDAFFDTSKEAERNSFIEELAGYEKQGNSKTRLEKLHDLLCNVLGVSPFCQQQANSVVDQYFLPFSVNLQEFLMANNLMPGSVHTEYHHDPVKMMQELRKEVEGLLPTIRGTSIKAKGKVEFLHPFLKKTEQSFWSGGNKREKAELEGFLNTVIEVIDIRIAEEGKEAQQKSLEVFHAADVLAKTNSLDSRLAARKHGNDRNDQLVSYKTAEQLFEKTIDPFDENALTEGDAHAVASDRAKHTALHGLAAFVNSFSDPNIVQMWMHAIGPHKGVSKLWFSLNPDDRDKHDKIKYEVAREEHTCFMLVFNAKFSHHVFSTYFQSGNTSAPKLHHKFVWYMSLKTFLQECFREEESKLFGYFKSLGWVNSEMDDTQRLQRANTLADVLFQLLKTENPLNIIKQMTEDHDDIAEDIILDKKGEVDDTPWLKRFEKNIHEWLEVSQKGKFNSLSELTAGEFTHYTPQEKAEISALCKNKTLVAANLVDSPSEAFSTTANDKSLAEYLFEQEGTVLLPQIVMAATVLFVMVGPDNLDFNKGQVKPQCALDSNLSEILLDFFGTCFAKDASSIVWEDDTEHVPIERAEEAELDCDPEDDNEAKSAEDKKPPAYMLGPAPIEENKILNRCLDDLKPQLLSYTEKRLAMLNKQEETGNTDEKAMLTNALDFRLMNIENLRALASNLENKKPKLKDESDEKAYKQAYKQAYKEVGFWCEALRFIYGGHLHRNFDWTGKTHTSPLNITAFPYTHDGTPVTEWIDNTYNAALENPDKALQLLDKFLLTLKLAYECSPPVCFVMEYDCFGQINEKKFKTQSLHAKYLKFCADFWVKCDECDCWCDTTKADMTMYRHHGGNYCKDTHKLVPVSNHDNDVLLCAKCHHERLEASKEANPCGNTRRTRAMKAAKSMKLEIKDDDQSTKGQALFSQTNITEEQQEAFENLAIALFAPEIKLNSLLPRDKKPPVINQPGGNKRDKKASDALQERIEKEMAKTFTAIEGLDHDKVKQDVLRALCQDEAHNAYFRHGKVCPCCQNSQFPVWCNSTGEPTGLRIVTVTDEGDVEILTNPKYENVERYKSSQGWVRTPHDTDACRITAQQVREYSKVIAENVDDIPADLSDRLTIVKSKEGNAAEISFAVCSNYECWRWMCLAIYDHYITTPTGKKASNQSRNRSFTRNVNRSFKQYCQSLPEYVDHQKKLTEYNDLHNTYMEKTDVGLRNQLRPGKDKAENLEFQARLKYEKMKRTLQPRFEQWCADNQKHMDTDQRFWEKFDPKQVDLTVVAVNPGGNKPDEPDEPPNKKQKTEHVNESDKNGPEDFAYMRENDSDSDHEDGSEVEPPPKRPKLTHEMLTPEAFKVLTPEEQTRKFIELQNLLQNEENLFA